MVLKNNKVVEMNLNKSEEKASVQIVRKYSETLQPKPNIVLYTIPLNKVGFKVASIFDTVFEVLK